MDRNPNIDKINISYEGYDVTDFLMKNMTPHEKLKLRYLCELESKELSLMGKIRAGINYQIAKRKLRKMIKHRAKVLNNGEKLQTG